MTTQVESSFEAVWPDLERRIHRFLGSKKVPDSQREDVVQETGLRLYRMWDQVDPAGSPIGLALTIAMNIVRDNARRDSHRTVVEIEPDVPAICDVERSGLARLELSRVRRALSELTPAQRSVLLSELDRNQRPPEASPAAIKMLRMRARRNLSAILERAGCGVLVARWRRFFGLPRQVYVPRDLSKVEQGMASSLAGVMAAAAISLTPISGLLGFGEPAAPDRDRTPNAAVAEEVWLGESSFTRASAVLRKSVPAVPRASNLDGESPLVRRSAAAGRAVAKAGGKGKQAPAGSPDIEVELPNGEGEIQGNHSVDVDVTAPTLEPGDGGPVCRTQPTCSAPDPTDPPGKVEASARVRVRQVEVEAEVNSDELVDGVEGLVDG